MPKKKPMTLAEYFGRTEHTQEELARELGISQGYLSMLLNGTRVPSLEMAQRISEKTGVPIESFLPRQSDTDTADAVA